jgi:hypothetical protein
MPLPTLTWNERLHYRDRFRAARYSALADAEGFGEICFAIEALGLRLCGEEAAMGSYLKHIQPLAADSTVLVSLTNQFPALFTRFEALYATIKNARNDKMHAGVYARHATTAAIELCIGLEEALMAEQQIRRETVADFMVKGPVVVEPWQPVAHARQLMLMYSFSYLPVYINRWLLVPEVSMARYLHRNPNRKGLLATPIEEAATTGLELATATVVAPTDNVSDLLKTANAINAPMLWLVQDEHHHLCGVLSPFELM